MAILEKDERLDPVNESIRLICKKDGLTFGTDAFLLASFIRPAPRGRGVELGAGTGIISLLCAARKRLSTIYALEIQEDFSTLAARNVILNGLSDRVRVRHCDLREIGPEQLGGEVDVVFTNPPYMRTDSGKRNESERKYVARHEVFGGIEDFCTCAERVLKHGGKFYCVWRPDRLSELMGAMSRHRLEPKVMAFVHGDPSAEPSMVLVSATKGGAFGMRILPPLFLHEKAPRAQGGRPLTKRAAVIYDTMNFYGEE